MIIIIVIAILVIWGIFIQRRLAGMTENINHAMNQIGIQLSSRFDALTALLELTKEYAAHEYQILTQTIRSQHSAITPSPLRKMSENRNSLFPKFSDTSVSSQSSIRN